MTVEHKSFYYNILPQGYMFRLLRVIVRPSTEPVQDYLITSALCYCYKLGQQNSHTL